VETEIWVLKKAALPMETDEEGEESGILLQEREKVRDC